MSVWAMRATGVATIAAAWVLLLWRTEDAQIFVSAFLTLPLLLLILKGAPGPLMVQGVAGLALALLVRGTGYGEAFPFILHCYAGDPSRRPGSNRVGCGRQAVS